MTEKPKKRVFLVFSLRPRSGPDAAPTRTRCGPGTYPARTRCGPAAAPLRPRHVSGTYPLQPAAAPLTPAANPARIRSGPALYPAVMSQGAPRWEHPKTRAGRMQCRLPPSVHHEEVVLQAEKPSEDGGAVSRDLSIDRPLQAPVPAGRAGGSEEPLGGAGRWMGGAVRGGGGGADGTGVSHFRNLSRVGARDLEIPAFAPRSGPPHARYARANDTDGLCWE
eukprot:gene25884-biopygen6036